MVSNKTYKNWTQKAGAHSCTAPPSINLSSVVSSTMEKDLSESTDRNLAQARTSTPFFDLIPFFDHNLFADSSSSDFFY